ncbi:hypothetical protein [Clostridium peptidivorans]|nr:hypothetical protein [Clostridium peptidivorans]
MLTSLSKVDVGGIYKLQSITELLNHYGYIVLLEIYRILPKMQQ